MNNQYTEELIHQVVDEVIERGTLSKYIAENYLYIKAIETERDALRATLCTIQTEAERFPVPGGYIYAISGELMGMVDKVLK